MEVPTELKMEFAYDPVILLGQVQNISEQDLQETLYASVYHNSHSSEEVEVTQMSKQRGTLQSPKET